MSRYTWGNTHRRNPPSNLRNSQTNASVYIVYVAKEPDSQLNSNADGNLKEMTILKDALMLMQVLVYQWV